MIFHELGSHILSSIVCNSFFVRGVMEVEGRGRIDSGQGFGISLLLPCRNEHGGEIKDGGRDSTMEKRSTR